MFRVYAPGRSLMLGDIRERHALIYAAGRFALLGAVLITAPRIAARIYPAYFSLFSGNTIFGRILNSLTHLVIAPLIALIIIQISTGTSSRFVLGTTLRTEHILFGAGSGAAFALTVTGIYQFVPPLFGAEICFPGISLLTGTVSALHSSAIEHILVLAVGTLLIPLALGGFCFGYIAPALDIGEHRTAAVIGSAAFFTFSFAEPVQLPAYFLFGLLFAQLRLASDSLYTALAAQIASQLTLFLAGSLTNRLAESFYGTTFTDPAQTQSISLILILGGAALFVPTYVILSSSWRASHTERLREAISRTGNRALPAEPERPTDILFIFSLAILAISLILLL
jgi:hypothetical protein